MISVSQQKYHNHYFLRLGFAKYFHSKAKEGMNCWILLSKTKLLGTDKIVIREDFIYSIIH